MPHFQAQIKTTTDPKRLRPWTENADRALMRQWYDVALAVVETGELPPSFGSKVNEVSAQGASGVRVGVYKGMDLFDAFLMAGFARFGPVWPTVFSQNIRYNNIGKALEVLAALRSTEDKEVVK
ncbi:MAG: hypothetical protein JRN45_00570 [Nitrososphaerota archaeon]|nr:hypothetical protein [Nitrososphaerota archaeon]